MQLHVKSKQLAWGGIMMTLVILLVVLSGMIESSSLFLLAAASFVTGVIQRKFTVRLSVIFVVSATILCFLLAPQKLYCFTYSGFSVYVILAEYYRSKYKNGFPKRRQYYTSWFAKGVLYHALLGVAFLMTKFVTGITIPVTQSIQTKILQSPFIIVVVTGVIAAEFLWIVFDKAYVFFQNRYGNILINIVDR